MDWGDVFSANVGTGPDPNAGVPAGQNTNDFIGQQQNVARLKAMADALRANQQAFQGNGQSGLGMMVGNRYIPNFSDMGRQIVSNMYQPSADTQLSNANAGMQRQQLAMAQQALQAAPQRFAAQSVDENGNPVEPDQKQSFPEYKKAMGEYAAQLIQNPMTRDMGMKLAGEISSGTLDQNEQNRLDKLQMAREAQDTKRQNAQLLAQNKLDVVGAQQAGANVRAKAANDVKLLTQGMMNPQNQLKMTNTLSAAADKELKPYSDEIDQVNAFNDAYQHTKQTGVITPSDASAMIDRFQRTVNPGASVKDSQYNRIVSMNPGLDALRLKVQGLVTGQVAMTPALADQIKSTLDAYSQDARKNMYDISNQHAQLAQSYGLDPTKIIKVESHRDPNHPELYANVPLQSRFDKVFGDGTPGSADPKTDDHGTTIIPSGEPMPTSYKDPKWDDLEKKVSPQFADMLKGIREKGERSNSDQVSSVGARTPYQITPQTRNAILQKYGYDAYASPENAVRAAAQVYQDGLAKGGGDKSAALDHYSGGASGYANRVLTKTAAEQKAAQAKTTPITASPVAPAPSGATGSVKAEDWLSQQGF